MNDLAAAAWGIIIGGLLLAVAVAEWAAQRRVDRLNAENRAAWEAAKAEAKRTGQPPPFPPNIWRRG